LGALESDPNLRRWSQLILLVFLEDVNNVLPDYGYEVIPSQTNFFMVNVKKDVTPVAQDFLKKGFIVGRKFPPLNECLRVSVGTDEDMKGFMKAFRQMFPLQTAAQTKAG
jgi:histidinol-phosphate aminotransferase